MKCLAIKILECCKSVVIGKWFLTFTFTPKKYFGSRVSNKVHTTHQLGKREIKLPGWTWTGRDVVWFAPGTKNVER